jgi:NAD(P)H-nitrite reductase large subunit
VIPPRYVIVGSGIAGLAAAEAMRQRVPRAHLSMISEEPHNFYSRPGLAYLLRGDIPEKQLFVRSPDDLRALQLNRINARVDQLLCDNHEVLLSDGRRIPYDRLLLATGSLTIAPTFAGHDLAGVVKLDSLDDARHLLKMARRGKTAVVIGGGITALELAEGLAARRLRVHYLLRGARYWADVLDESESRIIHERLRHEGVMLRLNTQVKQALGRRGQLTGVETVAGEIIPCQILAVAIGVRPRLELATRAGLKVDRGIVVNEFLQTSRADVYAAGDVAQVHDPHRGRATLDVLWSTALAQGQAAGANMAGAKRAYVKGIPFNVTQLGGLKVTIIGAVGKGSQEDLMSIARGDSEAWRLAPETLVLSERDDANRIRVLIGERTLVGALVMGDQTWSRPLQRLIVDQADITPIRSALSSGGTPALAHLANFYLQWERARFLAATKDTSRQVESEGGREPEGRSRRRHAKRGGHDPDGTG